MPYESVWKSYSEVLSCVCSVYVITHAVSPLSSDNRSSEKSASVTTMEKQSELLEPALGESGMLCCL